MNRRRFVTYGAGAVGLLWMATTTGAHQSNERRSGRTSMRIQLTSVLVEDQDKALDFYSNVLGFVKKQDKPVGAFKWLTVVSPEDPDGTELLLEPNANPAAKAYQKALFEQGIPLTAFAVDDVELEYERLKKLGVKFQTEPTPVESTKIAVFDDTCGNLIQLFEASSK